MSSLAPTLPGDRAMKYDFVKELYSRSALPRENFHGLVFNQLHHANNFMYLTCTYRHPACWPQTMVDHIKGLRDSGTPEDSPVVVELFDRDLNLNLDYQFRELYSAMRHYENSKHFAGYGHSSPEVYTQVYMTQYNGRKRYEKAAELRAMRRTNPSEIVYTNIDPQDPFEEEELFAEPAPVIEIEDDDEAMGPGEEAAQEEEVEHVHVPKTQRVCPLSGRDILESLEARPLVHVSRKMVPLTMHELPCGHLICKDFVVSFFRGSGSVNLKRCPICSHEILRRDCHDLSPEREAVWMEAAREDRAYRMRQEPPRTYILID